MGQVLPDCFSDERHVGVQQPQAPFQNIDQHPACCVRRSLAPLPETHFGHLNVPVAVLAPEKIVDLTASLSKLVAIDQAAHLAHQPVIAAQNPAIRRVHLGTRGQGLCWRHELWGSTIQVPQDEARSLPDLVGKVAVGLYPALRQPHVIARSGTSEQGEAQRVLPVFLDHEQGIIAPGIGQRLADFPTLFIANQTM